MKPLKGLGKKFTYRMNKINIISLGLSQSNFLTQLYKEIKLRDNKISFHIDGFMDLSKGNLEYKNQVFDSFHNFEKHRFSKIIQLQSFISLLFKRVFWIFLWFEIKQRKGAKYLVKFVRKEARNKACIDKIILPLDFDIYQFHFCAKNSLKYIHYLPSNSKIVCSFWGSDLYRDKSTYNAFYVKRALEKATYVTIQTPDMAEDLFKKYGDFLLEKIIYAQFAIETEIYDLIDLFRNDEKSLSEFKNKYRIPANNLVLTIGYNANKAFGHIKILEKLNLMDSSIKEKITCVLPLTYSRTDINYLQELYTVAKSTALNVVFLDSFISHEDIAKLRIITDIQIQLPVSDALSGSVTEVLYAGNIVLAGSWLPYGIYKRNDISIETCYDIENLNVEIYRIIDNLDKLKAAESDRKLKIENVFFPDYTTKAWINLYNRV